MSKFLVFGVIALSIVAYGVNAQCYISTGISSAVKEALLSKHNELRNKVASGQQSGQPAATNMQEMVWDDSLGTLAQNFANTCPSGHNPNRNGAGENLYWAMSSRQTTDVSLTAGVQSWYDEVSLFQSSKISPFTFTSGAKDYTQMIWASSNKLGTRDSE
jgi:hypothetical protein